MSDTPRRRNGYPPTWKLVQTYVPLEVWVALKQQNIASGQSVAAQVRQAIEAQINRQN